MILFMVVVGKGGKIMYLDPGFGGMLMQAIIALVAVGGATLYAVRRKIKDFFTGSKNKEAKRNISAKKLDDNNEEVIDALADDMKEDVIDALADNMKEDAIDALADEKKYNEVKPLKEEPTEGL